MISMIITSQKTDIRSNVGASETFKIVASAKAFDLLTDKLYRDKVMAVIRELSTNALDAHVDAGCGDEPFVVHLPTSLEPFFSITDKGTGMNDEQIRSLYTSFFASSKTNRNDQIGALGLGSKSPFAVTDSFNIESVKDGVKVIYTCFKGDQGPQVVLIDRMATSEANGVSISFPVQERQIDSFIDRAAQVFWAFAVEPIIVGATLQYEERKETYRIDKAQITVKGEGWDLYSRFPSFFLDNRVVHVKMGSIIYPISSSMIHTRSTKAQFVMNSRFLINLPLGVVDIAPSREELNYDANTCHNLITAFERVFDEFTEKLALEAEARPSAWEAIAFVRQALGSLQGTVPTHTIAYRGKTYSSADHFEVALKSTTALLAEISFQRGMNVSTVPQTLLKLIPSTTVGFVVLDRVGQADKNYSFRARVRSWMKLNGLRTVVLFNSRPDATDLAELGNPTIHVVSDIPKSPKAAKNSKAKEEKKPITLWSDPSKKVDPKKPGKYAYIVQKGQGYYWWNGQELVHYNKNDLLRAKTTLSKVDFPETVVVIPYSTFKTGTFNTSTNKWIPLYTAVSDHLNKWVAGLATVIEAEKKAESIRNSFQSLTNNLDIFTAETYAKNSVFGEMLAVLKDLPAEKDYHDQVSRKIDRAIELQNRGMGQIDKAVQKLVVDARANAVDNPLMARFFETYPLLSLISQVGWVWELKDKNVMEKKTLVRGQIEARVQGQASVADAILTYVKLIDAAA
jgi:hypothetical protein